MNANENLTNYLKRLREREGLSVKDLARKCGAQISLLYKAEKEGKNVRITSLHQAYRPLCHSDKEWQEVLLRWATACDPEGVSGSYLGAEIIGGLREEAMEDAQGKLQRLAEAISRVEEADFPLLDRFIREFGRNEHARAMASAWLEAVGG
jgi:transcriptional regulator with XRE-family HTH domain